MLIPVAEPRGLVLFIEFGYEYPMGKALSTTWDILGTKGECRSKGSVSGLAQNAGFKQGVFQRLPMRPKVGPIGGLLTILVLFCVLAMPTVSLGDIFEDSPPRWEPLLWGGKVGQAARAEQTRMDQSRLNDDGAGKFTQGGRTEMERQIGELQSNYSAPGPVPYAGFNGVNLTTKPALNGLRASAVSLRPEIDQPQDYYRAPFQVSELNNIPPLYVTPHLAGEGVWEWRGMPALPDGSPVMYRTSYRPSVKYPNAIVHMLMLDTKRLSMRLYIGSTEPGATKGSSVVEPEKRSGLLAITNALWKQKHSGEAGTIFRGTVVKKLFPGMATLTIYKDGSVDILEWSDSIPVSLISDAKQLKHLIVKDGRVVDSVIKGGQRADSEIGMGYLLVEDEASQSYSSYPNYWGYYGGGDSPTHTSGENWFIATRSAFGIRKDGNLVFAIGHHISTKDMAKALVLAGCERAVHGDSNPHNVLANLYFNSGNGDISKKAKLSPDQRSDTLNRYVDRSYTSDFFAFFTRGEEDEERDSS